MPENSFKRKLTAILHADVAGYSRLMEDYEAETLKTMNLYMGLIRKFIEQHSGHVDRTAVDYLVADFSSVVDAVYCAVEIQDELGKRNENVPGDKKVEFRIGINLGDVIENEDFIHGDGVNIAARIERLAEGGGIVITRSAYDQVQNKVNYGFRYIGKHEMKNIKDPVRVYRVLTDPKSRGVRDSRPKIEKKKAVKSWAKEITTGVIISIIATVIASVFWKSYKKPPSIVDEIKFDKPSLAVLPFTNMSSDKEQEYFSDGMTDDLITDLSKLSGLYVIARNTVFTYKGKSVKYKTGWERPGCEVCA